MMKLRAMIILFLGMVISHHAKAQREGDTWKIGYTRTPNNADFAIVDLDFRTGNLQVHWDYNEVMFFRETGSNICDSEGMPLLWTNGMQIRGYPNLAVLDTIASIDPSPNYWDFSYFDEYSIQYGFYFQTGAVILPSPGDINSYYAIYHTASKMDGFYEVDRWLYAEIEVLEDGSYRPLFKDSLLMEQHQWYSGTINATRHANGRDWWLVAFEMDSPKYFVFLADPSGIKLSHDGVLDFSVNDGYVSQVVFSPDGNYLARTETGDLIEGERLTLFHFNRCEGKLDFIDSLQMEDGSAWQGVAFSPSERYLYYTALQTQLWRIDMYATSILLSAQLVGEYDGFLEPEGHEPTSFGPMMQTPDGRIYIVPVAGSSQYLHVIDRPDEENPADIRLLQHHVSLVVRNGRTVPNIPNFRLGPLDGSPCDTLGINNLAKSRWRWEPDIVTQPLSIRFTDLSFYEPTAWHWDFGDGQTSEVVHPIHTFPDYGMYYVCQTVSNQYATDSTCHWVEIAPYTSDKEPKDGHTYFVSPNPFNHELSIQSTLDRFTEARISLFDIHGRSVMPSTQLPVPISINFADLPSGMYVLKLDISGKGMQVFKVVKD